MPATEYHVEITQPASPASTLLAEATGLSINKIKQAMQKGALWIEDDKSIRRLRRAKKTLAIGNHLHFYYNPEILDISPPSPGLLVDESDYSIWIKPRGLLSQGSKWGDHCTITRWVEVNDKKQRPAFLIHRLDRAATGLIIIGHTKRSAKAFTEMFAKKEIRKIYQAIVYGQFEGAGSSVTFNTKVDNRHAISHAKLIKYDPLQNRSQIEVSIETGRKHQIRRHLSEAGFPILGDRLYGGGSKVDLQLAAVSLAFICPMSGLFKEYKLPEPSRSLLCLPEPAPNC